MFSPVKLTAAAAVMALAFAGCASPSTDSSSDPSGSNSGPTKVKLAIQPWLGYGAWYIAKDQGFFAENNLDVEILNFDTDADMLAALASGNVDALNVASHGAMLMIEEGVDAKIVMLEDASTSADAILTDGSIADIQGLKGEQVAYEEGTTSDLLLNYALMENGLSINDITKVPLAASEAGAALIAGQVPVAVTYEPYITQAQSQSAEVKVLFEAGAKEGLISDVFMVGKGLYADKPEVVTALIKSWGQSVDFYNANTEEGRAIIAKGVGEDPAALTEAFDGVHFFDLADNKSQLTGEYVNNTLPTVYEVATNAGILAGTADVSTAVDASFLP